MRKRRPEYESVDQDEGAEIWIWDRRPGHGSVDLEEGMYIYKHSNKTIIITSNIGKNTVPGQNKS